MLRRFPQRVHTNRRLWSRVLCVSSTVVAVAVACSDEVGTGDNQPAPPGAIQPDASGGVLNEAEACQMLLAAIQDRASTPPLDCDVSELTCPELIRTAGSQACLQFDEGSVTACVGVVESYELCTDFETKPCIVTALPGTMSAGCTPPMPDAGADTGGGPDASGDGSVGMDGSTEGGSEGGADAEADALSDATSDAPADAGTD